MNIAVSIVGEGLGHSTRQIALIRKLQKNHTITVFCPENIEPFLKKSLDCDFVSIPHIRLVKKNNKLLPYRTVVKFLYEFYIKYRNSKKKLVQELKKRNIDAVIVDYEPIMAIVAKRAQLPVISINHQAAVRFDWSLPSFYVWVANKYMMPYFNKSFSVSFYNGDIGPVLRDEVKNAKVETQDFFVVYPKKVFSDALKNIDATFKLFPSEKEDFVTELAKSKGVITTAGHQLATECMHLKKPLLVLPQDGQYEQQLNAKMTKASGWGEICDPNDKEGSIREFIENIDHFPHSVDRSKLTLEDDTEFAIKKIEHALEELV